MYILALFICPLSCSPTKLSTPLPIPIPFIQPSCPKSCQYKAPPSVHALTGNGFPVLSLLPRLHEPRCHVMLWRHTIYWAFCRHFVFRDHVIVHCLCVQPISVGARARWLSHMTNVIGSKYANSSWRHIILTRNFVPLFLTVVPWQHWIVLIAIKALSGFLLFIEGVIILKETLCFLVRNGVCFLKIITPLMNRQDKTFWKCFQTVTALFTKPPSSVLPAVGMTSQTVPATGPIHGLRDF